MIRPMQLPLDLGHRPALGGEDFLIGAGNAEAVAWLDRWPQWPAPALALYGPPGCGKTHLAHVWRARTGAPLVTPATLDLTALPALIGTARAVAVDDADAAAGNPEAERALFHLYNLAAQAGGHLLLVATTAPAHWPLSLADLRSRLSAAPAVAVGAPDDHLLAALLVKLFIDRQLHPGPEVVHYLTGRMERSADAARRLVAALDAAALAAHRPITVPLAREILDGGIKPAGLQGGDGTP